MKRLSLQWRITLMSVLLIGITCVAMNLLLCSSGVYYMDTIADSLQGGGTVILNDSGAASFDPQLIAPNEELTIVVDGVQGRFRTTNWYITAAVTLLSGILAYFVSGRALKPLRSFASQVEQVQLNNLADMRIDEDTISEFRQLSRSFNQMLERLNNAFSAQRQFTGNAAHELRTPLALMQAQLELFSAEHPDVRPETAEFLTLLREQTERLTQMTKTLLEMSNLQQVARNEQLQLAPMVEEIFTDLASLAEKRSITLEAEGDAALTGSDAYAEMTRAQRLDAAVAQLQQLAEEGLVSARSLHVDEENGMVSFAYSCGALGGVLVEDPDEENTPFAPSELPAVDLHEMSNAPQGDLGSAMIYYAFDNTVNSSRYPYYSYMKGFWTAMGLHTRIDTTVTVSDLKRMNDYGLCILSAHGSYYTYTSGFLFKQTRTEPVILLTEESDFYKDLYYGIDLLTHRVIKINGLYCITPSFFQAAYRGGQLKDTVVLSETCEFLGVSGSLDTSMADALLAGGAKAVAGYVNNVYTVYSRSMLWDTVNHLILGQTLQESVQHSMDTYGADDLVWYNAQGGKRPHAAAAYPLLFGDVGVRLIEPNAAPVPQEVQQAA